MRIWTIMTAVLLAAAMPAGAAGDEVRGRVELNPEAPPETAQFAFLVGEWDCVGTVHSEDGDRDVFTAVWRIEYILDGWALRDEWVTTRLADGRKIYGTMYRTYNKEAGHWEIVEQTTPELEFLQMTAEKSGETMIMRGVSETPSGEVMFRRVFSDIREDSFLWTYDYSRDGGETWTESYLTMKVERRQ